MAKIEWTDITRNPIKGKCPKACPYCYAREIYDKNKWDPFHYFRPDVLDDLPKKPCRIFVGSTMELFIFPQWLPSIFEHCRQHPEHTFIFLTKSYEDLATWSLFPPNCHVGATVTENDDASRAYVGLSRVSATVRFISFEPMIGQIGQDKLRQLATVTDGWIIGAMTGQKGKLEQLRDKLYPQLRLEKLDAVGRKWTLLPRLEWVKEIVEAAGAAGLPVFIKDNLYKLMMEAPGEDHDLYWEDMANLRQELPDRREKALCPTVSSPAITI